MFWPFLGGFSGGRRLRLYLVGHLPSPYKSAACLPSIGRPPAYSLRVGRLPSPAPDPVDVPLEVAALNELGQQMLCENRHRAGVERDFLLQSDAQFSRQDHVAHTDSRRDRAREGVRIDDTPLRLQREEGVFRLR